MRKHKIKTISQVKEALKDPLFKVVYDAQVKIAEDAAKAVCRDHLAKKWGRGFTIVKK